MKNGTRALLLAALVGVVAWAPTAAAGPTTDLVEVMAAVGGVYQGPGGDVVAQLEWGARTHADAPALSVLVNAYIVFPNHVRQQVFPPEVVTLQPDSGIIKLGFAILPGQAGLGTATFHVEGRVLWVGSGVGGSGGLAIATDTFEMPLQLLGQSSLRNTHPRQEPCRPSRGKRGFARNCESGFDVLD